MDSWDLTTMKDTEERVFQAIKILLDSIDDIEIFNKKAIYLYLREITGLNTKQIVRSGSKLYSKLREMGHEVVGIDLKEGPPKDILDCLSSEPSSDSYICHLRDVFSDFKPEYIFHLACIPRIYDVFK